MTIEKMTIHKALSELKIIDDRIVKAIADGTYCIANKHNNDKIKGIPIADFQKSMLAAYNKATDLIRRRNAIKRAVVLSNAVTKVLIGQVEYTVAEAIEMKNHGLTFKEKLLEHMREQYELSLTTILKNNGDDLERRAESYIVGIYGNKEGKTDTEDFKKAKQDFIASQSFELIDPLNIERKMDILEQEISAFRVEVDAALSTSNALTEIEVSY